MASLKPFIKRLDAGKLYHIKLQETWQITWFETVPCEFIVRLKDFNANHHKHFFMLDSTIVASSISIPKHVLNNVWEHTFVFRKDGTSADKVKLLDLKDLPLCLHWPFGSEWVVNKLTGREELL